MKLILFLVVAVVHAEPQGLFGQVLNQSSKLANVASNQASQFANVASNQASQLANVASNQASQLANEASKQSSRFLKAFESFMSSHRKVYGNSVLAAQAQSFFLKNFEEVEAHNKKFAQGLFSFKIGVNEFFDGDLLNFIKILCGTVAPSRLRRASQPKPSTFPAGPESIDFSANMQPIVNQGNCGGCWSFATIAQLESLYSRTMSSSLNISQQFLLDCTNANKGCNGGWPKTAMGTDFDSNS